MGDDASQGANSGYALGQLQRALQHALRSPDAPSADQRVARWRQVLEGMQAGALDVGSRTPVEGAPAWATLEVVHGGFATGGLLAGGELLPHERELAARLGHAAAQRAALNLHYLSDEGRAELARRLEDGRYRVQVPEEGALLAVTWLLDHGQGAEAAEILDQITPFLDRLRFYPVPDPRPFVPSAVVKLQSVGEKAEQLSQPHTHRPLARMREALQVWAPLYDRTVALWLETVDGPVPVLATTPQGELVRRPDGQGQVEGGWPCRRIPDGWELRARALLDEFRQQRARHTLCAKPERPKENFPRLRAYLERWLAEPASLTGRDVGAIRKILASFVTRHGAPRSERLARVRAEQARNAALADHDVLRRVLVQRLQQLPGEDGLASLDELGTPLSQAEATRHGLGAGHVLPSTLVRKLERCVEATVEQHVARGVIASGDVLAWVLPQITAQVWAAGLAEPELRRLYTALYAAFRRRRSLLLLDLQHQVRLGDLPWVAALDDRRREDPGARLAAHRSLEQLTTLALTAFPQALVPNRLLQELGALAGAAGLDLPLVEELAADIFQGTFSAKFLRAAQTAARLLEGSLYERYYGLPYAYVRSLAVPAQGGGVRSSPEFAALCHTLAGAPSTRGRSAASNGLVIEQQQILTTQNLAVLFDALGLADTLRARLPELAQDCLRWICRRLRVKVTDWRAQLARVKNVAYTFRHMVFFLSLVPEPEQRAFVHWAHEHAAARLPDPVLRCFAPALRGLELTVDGGTFGPDGHADTGARRLLGWTTQRHWLIP